MAKKIKAVHKPAKMTSEEKFVQDVLTRGEAATRDINGKLPEGATHEIVKQEPGKLPEIRRARFSLV